MLVGDYCPRALDPVSEMLEAEEEHRHSMASREALSSMTEAAIE